MCVSQLPVFTHDKKQSKTLVCKSTSLPVDLKYENKILSIAGENDLKWCRAFSLCSLDNPKNCAMLNFV